MILHGMMVIGLWSLSIVPFVSTLSVLLPILLHHRSRLVILMIGSTSLIIHILIHTSLLVWLTSWMASLVAWLLVVWTIVVSSLGVYISGVTCSLPVLLVHHHVLLLLIGSLSHWRWHSKSVLLPLIHIGVNLRRRLVTDIKVVGASSCTCNPWWRIRIWG